MVIKSTSNDSIETILESNLNFHKKKIILKIPFFKESKDWPKQIQNEKKSSGFQWDSEKWSFEGFKKPTEKRPNNLNHTVINVTGKFHKLNYKLLNINLNKIVISMKMKMVKRIYIFSRFGDLIIYLECRRVIMILYGSGQAICYRKKQKKKQLIMTQGNWLENVWKKYPKTKVTYV